jgi:hypothetical protein
MMTFAQFFETATGQAPYDYKRRLAGGDAGRACETQLINVPTGLAIHEPSRSRLGRRLCFQDRATLRSLPVLYSCSSRMNQRHAADCYHAHFGLGLFVPAGDEKQ